jgi:5-formyltetrahydrofolate cyclo-ligase
VSDRAGLRAAKQAMRALMRELRGAIPPEERRSLAKQVEERLFGLPAMRDAQTVMLFSSFGTEVPTQRMIERAWDAGQRVVLPLLRQGSIRVAAVRRGQALWASSYGPMEPPDDEPVASEEIEVVVAPGLAFDRSANRLGYGGGHYDRLLGRLQPDAKTIGIGFQVQLVDAVPHGRSDRPLDAVVTDREVVIGPRAPGR